MEDVERSRLEREIQECWEEFDRKLERFQKELDGTSPKFRQFFREAEDGMQAGRQKAYETYIKTLVWIENQKAQVRPDTLAIWKKNALEKYRLSAQMHQMFINALITKGIAEKFNKNKEG
jgi:hypothetical protein